MQDKPELLETTDQPAEAEPSEEPREDVVVSLEPPEGAPQGEAVQLPTVVILVERGEGPNGQIDVDVVAQGDVRATEIETVLKMGLNKWRQKINLPG